MSAIIVIAVLNIAIGFYCMYNGVRALALWEYGTRWTNAFLLAGVLFGACLVGFGLWSLA